MADATVMQDPKVLRDKVEEIDCRAQSITSGICAMSTAAQALLMAGGLKNVEAAYRLLAEIRKEADELSNDINYIAETVGANFVDSAERNELSILANSYRSTRAPSEVQHG